MAEDSLVGKKVKVFFDDGNKVVYKPGILKYINSGYLELLNDSNELEIINFSRVVRIEEL